MDATQWGNEEQPAEADFAATAVIAEELPRALALPSSTRYRCFVDELAEEQSLQRCRYGSSFVVHKRRRQEMTGAAKDEEPLVLVVPRRRTSPFDLAQRRLETFRWLSQPRATEDIQSRFALDRRIGASPNVASLRRAVKSLHAMSTQDSLKDQHRRAARSAIVDLLEELVLENSRHLSPALCLDMVDALSQDPLDVARLLLVRHATQLASPAAAMQTVWGPLCSAMAAVALSRTSQAAHHLDPTFVHVFERVVELTRGAGELSRVHAAAFGRCLLLSGDVGLDSRLPPLVRNDILDSSFVSAKLTDAQKDTSSLVVGAFLSDVVRAAMGRGEARDVASGVGPSAEWMQLGCEIVEYAASHRAPLTSDALQALVEATAAAQCPPSKTLALFVFMCVVATPTITALHTALQCAFDASTSQPTSTAAAVLPGEPALFFVWCARRFAPLLFFAAPKSATEQTTLLQQDIGSRLGAILCPRTAESRHTGPLESHRLRSASDVLASLNQTLSREAGVEPAAAVAFLAAFFRGLQEATACQPARLPCSELHRLNRAAHVTMLHGLPGCGLFQSYWSHSEQCADGAAQEDSLPSLATVLRSGIAEGCSCNVLDGAACNLLAACPSKEAAFVKMMEGYMTKKGALALVPFQALVATPGMTPDARAMLRRWQQGHSDWFACVPLALSLCLDSRDATFDACCGLLRVIQENDHKRVAIMTGDEARVDEAKKRGVLAVIFLGAVLAKLGV